MDREPDSATIDAWLAGQLSPQEVAEIEAYFEAHPLQTALGLTGSADDTEEIDPALLSGLKKDSTHADPVLTDLIRNITGGQEAAPGTAPSGDGWRDVLSPSDDDAILGYLGNYEVIEVIAVGGMGIVFKAYDPELDRLAALKVLAPDLAANATARQRFLREARAAAKLEHENILPIYGVVDDGIPWFAMRYIPGGTLQDRLDKGEVFAIDALKPLSRQVAGALDAAHTQGLVHRDIKPANLLFGDDGEHVWVCDFGIAQSADDPTLTYPGAIAGTPKFMSPEQAEGRELDGRSDLYSLGAVLYRCVVGEDTLAGETTTAVLRELSRNRTVEIAAGQSDLPGWYRHLLNNLLARDPDDRPESAAAVVRAIDDEHSPPPRYRARRLKRVAFWLVSLLMLAGTVFGLAQVTTVEQSINGLIGGRYRQAFVITDRIGAYPDLRRAIFAAGDGDTIELPVEGPIMIDNTVIRSGKSLTLVSSDRTRRPQLTTEISGVPGLVSRSDLSLIGLDFVVNAKRDSSGILIVDDATVSLDDCRFVARREVLKPDEDVKSRAVELQGNSTIKMVDCDFDLRDTSAITVSGKAADIDIRSSRIAAYYGIDLSGADTLIERLSVTLDNQKFVGQSFLHSNARYPSPHIRVEAFNSQFDCARPVCDFRTNEVNLIRSRTKWVGENNRFRLGNAVVQISAHPTLWSAAAVLPVEWFADDPTPGEPPVAFLEGTDKIFTSLQEAVDQAPDGATLLLSGRIEVKGQEVVTPHGKVLHFRRHPKARERPTVVAMSREQHAVFAFGPVTFSGIRFARYDANEFTLPVLGIRAGMESQVKIEDCEFDAVPSLLQKTSSATGLSVTNTGEATIRRCLFRCGHGIMAAFVQNTSGRSRLIVEDSVFIGQSALHLYSRVAVADVDVSLARCSVYTRYLMSTPPSHVPIPSRVAVADSLIDVRRALFWIPDHPVDPFIGTLTWAGENNHYSRGFLAHQNPRMVSQPGDYQFINLKSMDELVEKFPGSSERGSTSGDIFDDEKLPAPVTPESLRASLKQGIDSPAVAALESFAESGD